MTFHRLLICQAFKLGRKSIPKLLLRLTHGLEGLDGDLQHFTVRFAGSQGLQGQVGLDHPLDKSRIKVIGRPTDIFHRNTSQYWDKQDAAD